MLITFPILYTDGEMTSVIVFTSFLILMIISGKLNKIHKVIMLISILISIVIALLIK